MSVGNKQRGLELKLKLKLKLKVARARRLRSVLTLGLTLRPSRAIVLMTIETPRGICRLLQPRKINAKTRMPGGSPGFFVFVLLHTMTVRRSARMLMCMSMTTAFPSGEMDGRRRARA